MTAPRRVDLAARLFGLVLPPRDVDAIVGDLEEELAACPRADRVVWYWLQVARSMPWALWLPVSRSGWLPSCAIAGAAVAVQIGVELATGFAIHEMAPANAAWPPVVALAVTLLSLTVVSYVAAGVREGAAPALGAMAAFLLGVQLVLSAATGRGVPLMTAAAFVVCPVAALTGGFWRLRSR